MKAVNYIAFYKFQDGIAIVKADNIVSLKDGFYVKEKDMITDGEDWIYYIPQSQILYIKKEIS